MKYLYIHSPSTVVTGQVNFSFDGVFPVADIPIMSVTGDMGDVKAGMTVLFGSTPGSDNLGRQRVRNDHITSDTQLRIGYSSQGIHDGEVNIVDESYFTILDERRVWTKSQRFFKQLVEPFVTVLKDYDLSFSGLDMSTGQPPKANAGPARAGTINSGTGVLTCSFDATGSFSVPLGVGLASVLWDFKDGTITVGSSTSNTPTVTFPPGFRYISLTVTDTDGRTHRMEIPVYARDPEADTCVAVWQMDLTRDQEGQRLSVKLFSELNRSLYPDGSVTLMFDDDQVNHYTEFYGWIYTDPMTLDLVRTGAIIDTTLECRDLGGMLDTIPGQSLVVENRYKLWGFRIAENATVGAEILILDPLPIDLDIGAILVVGGTITIVLTSIGAIGTTAVGIEPLTNDVFVDDVAEYEQMPEVWGEFFHPEMYVVMDYILRFHSTAMELGDFLLPTIDSGFGYEVYVRECAANTVYRQVQEQAHSICKDHNFGTNIRGQMVLRIDPMVEATISRTSTVQANLNGHIQAVRTVHHRPPRLQWLKGGAVVQTWDPPTPDIEVDYIIRPSAQALAGATSISVYPLPVDIPSGSILYLIGLGGQLLEWATTSANAFVDDETISVLALDDTVDIWDELQYTATETGEPEIVTVFAVAPGLTTGMGPDSQTINNKICANAAELQLVIGNLWAKYNSEWEDYDVDLSDEDLEDIDPSEFTWITADEINVRYNTQRGLKFFDNDTRFLPVDFTKSYRYDKTGVVGSFRVRLQRETVGILAVEVTSEDI